MVRVFTATFTCCGVSEDVLGSGCDPISAFNTVFTTEVIASLLFCGSSGSEDMVKCVICYAVIFLVALFLVGNRLCGGIVTVLF